MKAHQIGCLVLCLSLGMSACSSPDTNGTGSDGSPSESPTSQTAVSAIPSEGSEKGNPPMSIEAFQEHTPGIHSSEQHSFFKFSNGTLQRNGDIMEAHRNMATGETPENIEAYVLNAYDLFFDADHGFATNSKVAGWELGFGNGGIVDMGQVALDEVTEAPAEGYTETLDTEKIMVGHTYCVRTASGTEFGKMHIVSFDKGNMTAKVTWAFQKDGSRQFSQP